MIPSQSNTSSTDPSIQQAYWEDHQRQQARLVRPASPIQLIQRPPSPDPRVGQGETGGMELDEERDEEPAAGARHSRESDADGRQSSEESGAGIKRARNDDTSDSAGSNDAERVAKRVRLMPASEPVIVNTADQKPLTAQERAAGFEALAQAIDAHDVVRLQQLLDSGQVDLNWAPDGITPLLCAELSKFTPSVLILLNAGAGSKRELDQMLRHYVAIGNIDVVAALLRRGADPNQIEMPEGSTILQLAVENGNIGLVERLLAAGATLEFNRECGISLMVAAAKRGDISMLRVLLKHGAAVDEANYHDETALMAAARRGHAETFDFLLSQKASLYNLSHSGDTLLICAAQGGNRHIVDRVLQADSDIDIDSTNESDETALMRAAKYGNAEIFDYLRSLGASIDAKTGSEETLLMLAAEGGNLQIVKTLLESGADINEADSRGRTPLLVAVKTGQSEIASALIDAGASLRLEGRSLINVAAEKGYVDIVKLLLKAGCDPNERDASGSTPLLQAAGNKRIDVFECLIVAGASLEVTTKRGETALMLAIVSDDLNMVQRLLQLGVDINQKTKDGSTALWLAVSWVRTDMVAALIKAGAAVDVSPEPDNHPLMVAILRRNLTLVNLLIDAKCNVNIIASDGLMPLSLAIANKSAYMVKALIDAGANFHHELELKVYEPEHSSSESDESAPSVGKTLFLPPLHLAVFAGEDSMVELLLDRGAAINAPDRNGITPLMHAVIQKKTHLVELLLSRGADAGQLMPAGTGMPDTPHAKFTERAFLLHENRTELSVLSYEWSQNHDQDKSAFSAADIAIRDEETALLELLLRHGASPQRAVPTDGPSNDLVMHWRSSSRHRAAADDAQIPADHPLDDQKAIVDFLGTSWTTLLDGDAFGAAVIDHLHSVTGLYTPLQTALRETIQRELISETQSRKFLQALAGMGRSLSIAQKQMLVAGAFINLETLPITWGNSGSPFDALPLADSVKIDMTKAAGEQAIQLAELGRMLQAPLTDGLSELLTVCAGYTKVSSDGKQVQIDSDGLVDHLTSQLGLFGPMAGRVANAWSAAVDKQTAVILAHDSHSREVIRAQYPSYDSNPELMAWDEVIAGQGPDNWPEYLPFPSVQELVEREDGENPLAQGLLVSLGNALKAALDDVTAGLLRDGALQGEAQDAYSMLMSQQLYLLRQFWEQAIAAQ